MKLVIQRVLKSQVKVEDKTVGEINKGYLILLGVSQEDNEQTVKILAQKTVALRIMADKDKKMNKSILETDGEILVVSQFTLLANTQKGRRPSFITAADPLKANKFFEMFVDQLKQLGVKKVAKGTFGAYMQVSLINDGPVTIILS